ncbi:MAG TPA: MBL fold metallo-hydrolase, partial [Isosphaeraceae bacterium]|nr:MBL fold metallo-hydrolase [Isosphaeraceae bacterium]
CGAADADAVEDPALILARLPNHWLNRTIAPRWTGPAHSVSRQLREGDEIGGFSVLETPGHSVGHVAYWRAGDRVLVLGDVLINLHMLTGLPRLGEPISIFTPDPARNRQSARRLAELEPALVCFGHGPPVRDTKKFVDFLNKMAD